MVKDLLNTVQCNFGVVTDELFISEFVCSHFPLDLSVNTNYYT